MSNLRLAPDELIGRLRARVPGYDLHLNGPPPAPAPPFDLAMRAGIEARLGFALSDLLVRLYHEIGNGGFGPGYGLMGLGKGGFPDDLGATADTLYTSFRTDELDEEPLDWPSGLLPICHFGCAIYHCIDSHTQEMVIWEPSFWEEGQTAATALFPTGLRLADWLAEWAAGKKLSDLLGKNVNGELKLAPMADRS